MSTILAQPDYHYHYVPNEEKYDFSPLKSKSHIRLLILHDVHAGDTTLDAPLRGSIVQLKLDSDLGHTVLSNVPDHRPASKSIETPDGSISITPSLHDALFALRRMVTSPPLLWTAEISLKGEDVFGGPVTFNHVHAMKQIYTQAQQVVGFLGPDEDDTGEAHAVFAKLARLNVNDEATFDTFDDLVTHGLPPSPHPDWIAVDKFLSKPWFRSITALPAFMWAKQLQLVGERWSLNGDMFIRAALDVSTLTFPVFGNGVSNDELASGASCLTVFSKVRMLRLLFNRQSSFASLLPQCRFAEASSLSERLAIVAAICSKGDEAAVAAVAAASMEAAGSDTMTEAACCVQTVKSFFQSPEEGLQLLSLGGLTDEHPQLPSWLPTGPSRFKNRMPLSCSDFQVSTVSSADADCLERTRIRIDDDGTLKAFAAPVPCSCPGHNRIAIISRIPDRPGQTKVSGLRHLLALWYHVQEICSHMFTEAHEPMTQYQGTDADETLLEAAWTTLHKGKQAAATAAAIPTSMASARAIFTALQTPEIQSVLAEHEASARPAMDYLADEVEGWKFSVTHTGYMGLVPEETEEGDVVMAVYGARVPFVLRPCEKRDEVEDADADADAPAPAPAPRFRLVGECYLHGIMMGEVRAKLRFEEVFIT